MYELVKIKRKEVKEQTIYLQSKIYKNKKNLLKDYTRHWARFNDLLDLVDCLVETSVKGPLIYFSEIRDEYLQEYSFCQ